MVCQLLDVVDEAIELPLRIDLLLSTQGETIEALVVPEIAEDRFDGGETLAVLPPHGDYNADWLPVLMAVHDAFPDQRGIDLIEQWSPGYKGEVGRKWRSFEGYSGPRVTIASLFHRAKQYGYEPIKRQVARTSQRGSDITDALARRRNGHAL